TGRAARRGGPGRREAAGCSDRRAGDQSGVRGEVEGGGGCAARQRRSEERRVGKEWASGGGGDECTGEGEALGAGVQSVRIGRVAGGDVRRVGVLLFFFQAEDGIRDGHVTGVQTCALPILLAARRAEEDRVAAKRRDAATAELATSQEYAAKLKVEADALRAS